jgi:ABC-2 type transport system ATP-binding protein
MTDAPPAVRLEGLAVRYGERTALAGVSLSAPQGGILALLGPNGSGKTTALRVLSTLRRPDGGRAEVFGLDVAREPAAVRRRIGVVFQAPALDRKLTVGENLLHQGHLYGLRGGELRARIRGALDAVGLLDRARDRVETLSGGLARRVEIAKCVLHRPDLLLLDEPTSALDPGARREVWDLLRELRSRSGTTVLFATHLLEEAEGSDRIAIFDRGRVVEAGVPAELRAAVGLDIVTVDAADPDALRTRIAQRFSLPAVVLDGSVRVECEAGHEIASRLREAFGEEIRSVAVSRPTLEDVFIRKTGRRLRDVA